MKNRFVVSLTFVLMIVFVLEFSCAKGSMSEDATISKDKASEAPVMGESQDPSKVIAARVNGREITMESLGNEMTKKARMRRTRNTPTEEETEQMKKDSLDTLIFLDLATEYGQKNIRVSDDEIDASIKKLKDNLKTDQAYDDYLSKSHYTKETLRKEIEKRLVIQKVFQQEVNDKAVLDKTEARKEYDAQQKIFTRPERIEVDYLSIDPGEDKERAKKRAEDIAVELKEVKSAEIIKDKTGIRVNTITISEDENLELFRMVSTLEPLDVSDVFEMKDLYHVMIVRKKIPEELIPFDKAKKWFEERAKKNRAMEWMEELKKDAKIEILLYKTEEKAENE